MAQKLVSAKCDKALAALPVSSQIAAMPRSRIVALATAAVLTPLSVYLGWTFANRPHTDRVVAQFWWALLATMAIALSFFVASHFQYRRGGVLPPPHSVAGITMTLSMMLIVIAQLIGLDRRLSMVAMAASLIFMGVGWVFLVRQVRRIRDYRAMKGTGG